MNPHNIVPEPEKEYLAMITYLPVNGYLNFPGFFKDVSAVNTQLLKAKGLIGFMLRAEILTKNAYTVSVWEGRDSLLSFIGSGNHKEIMSKTPAYLSDNRKFIEFKIKGGEIPPSWERVFQIVKDYQPEDLTKTSQPSIHR